MGGSRRESLEAISNSLPGTEGRALTDSPPNQSADHDGEGGSLVAEGYFSQHCDTASLSSFSLDTPSLARRPHPQEDTASLVSTGTLVPEAIYLPPAGHRLVTHSDWDALNTQVRSRLLQTASLLYYWSLRSLLWSFIIQVHKVQIAIDPAPIVGSPSSLSQTEAFYYFVG